MKNSNQKHVPLSEPEDHLNYDPTNDELFRLYVKHVQAMQQAGLEPKTFTEFEATLAEEL